tara:strand:+ start:952 stop:1782 length:831 start_codon:yes stop_codon:yes gene_type:complete
MPVATSFQAKGRRNGFPFCPSNVDVSGFDHWVTLAGVTSGSATEIQIKTSLERCMNLYWNTELVKTSVDAEANNAGDSAQLNTQDFEHKIMKTATVALEPRERVCYENLTGLQLSQSAASSGGSETCQATVSFTLSPVRMYNGATTDINNFVGFGFSDLITGNLTANHFGGLLDAQVRTTISSYLNGTTASGTTTDPSSVTEFNNAVHDFTVNSIPFKAFNQASMSSTTYTMSPTFVNQPTIVSVSDTVGTSPNTVHSDAEIDLGTNLSLSSYTYS